MTRRTKLLLASLADGCLVFWSIMIAHISTDDRAIVFGFSLVALLLIVYSGERWGEDSSEERKPK